MPYMLNKYTKEYFLKQNENGCPTNIGVEGAELFKTGKGNIREHDAWILTRLNFTNKVVVDFGFGRGEALKFAHQNGAIKLIGVDFSEEAYDIASEYLITNKVRAELFNKDVLSFIKNDLTEENKDEIDILIMLDFVEHVPRTELTNILKQIKPYLSKGAILAVNTPAYPIDNDVLEEGLKREAVDDSDFSPVTQGMHCNRYSKESLIKYMQELGFRSISGHYFYYGGETDEHKSLKALVIDEPYEYPNNPYNSDKYFIALPAWHTIQNGPLIGRKIYTDPRGGSGQEDMVSGNADNILFDYLKKINVANKKFYDIGANIGYHSMAFASLGGSQSKVFAFEPNDINIERMNLIFSKNQDLANRIKIINDAISDKNEEVDFNFSSSIDDGKSAGCFIDGAQKPFTEDLYVQWGFIRKKVHAVTLDSLMNTAGFNPPDVLKIDIEGAECLALAGGKKLVSKFKPLLLIEIHSLDNLFEVVNYFKDFNYDVLEYEYINASRIFIIASHFSRTDLYVGSAIPMDDILLGTMKAANKERGQLFAALENKNIEFNMTVGSLRETTDKLENYNTELNSIIFGLNEDINSGKFLFKALIKIVLERRMPWLLSMGRFLLRIKRYFMVLLRQLYLFISCYLVTPFSFVKIIIFLRKEYFFRFTGGYDLVIDHDLGGGTNHFTKTVLAPRAGNKIYLKYNFHFKRYFFEFRNSQGITEQTFDSRFILYLLFFVPKTIILNSIVSFPRPLFMLKLLIFLTEIKKIPITYKLHDYFCYCPKYSLFNSHEQYCKVENDEKKCSQCLLETPNSDDVSVFHYNFIDINAWRKTFEKILSISSSIFCFSESSKDILKKCYPKLDLDDKCIVRPHTVDYVNAVDLSNKKITDELVIGVLGTINLKKGLKVIVDLERYLTTDKALPKVRFVIIGKPDGEMALTSKTTGKYVSSEITNIVKDNQIDAMFIPSLWPETFSYTTRESIMMGLPVVVFNLGAQAEQVYKYEKGLVLDTYHIPDIIPQIREFIIKYRKEK